MEWALLLLGGVLVAMFVPMFGALRREQLADEGAEAAALGLRTRADGHWVGTRGEIRVRVSTSGLGRWKIVAELPFLVPRGFEIPGADPLAKDADLLGLGLEDALDRAKGKGWRPRIGDAVTLQVAERWRIADGIDAAADLAERLSQRHRSLIAPASRLGADEEALQGETAEGEIDGVPVRIVLPWVDGERWSTTITAWWTTPLPDGTVLRPTPPRRVAEDTIGDLFLDTALHIVTSDPDALKERLAHDELRGPLLDLVCGYPDSIVMADRVEHVVHIGALDVGAALERVLEVVRLVG